MTLNELPIGRKSKIIEVRGEGALRRRLLDMELPNYRLPSAKSVALLMWDKAKDFLMRAFTVIFVATIIIWFLQTFDTRLNVVATSADSMLAGIGKLIAPLFAPLGFTDWRVSTALITGFTAKEAVVSTLAVLTGTSVSNLPDALAKLFTPLTAWSYLTFTLLYTPCVAAINAVRHVARIPDRARQRDGILVGHAGVDQKQAVVIAGHQRKAVHYQMILTGEKIKEHPSEFVNSILLHKSIILHSILTFIYNSQKSHALRILVKTDFLLKADFILLLKRPEITDTIFLKDLIIRLRIVLVIIDAIHDTAQAVLSGAHQAVQLLAVKRCLDFLGISLADRCHHIGVNNASLEIIGVTVRFQLIGSEIIRRKPGNILHMRFRFSHDAFFSYFFTSGFKLRLDQTDNFAFRFQKIANRA